MQNEPLPEIDGERAGLRAGATLFDAGRWFEAHEAWESQWLRARGPRRALLQGLILAAAALHQRERGIERGAQRLWLRGRAKLAPAACAAGSAFLAPFLAGMDATMASGEPPPALLRLLREGA